MKVDKHGYKMTGIRKVAGESKCLIHPNSGNYLQVNYNKKTGHVWANFHVNSNSWTVYNDFNIIGVAWLTKPHTMQEIADEVAEAIEFDRRCCV